MTESTIERVRARIKGIDTWSFSPLAPNGPIQSWLFLRYKTSSRGRDVCLCTAAPLSTHIMYFSPACHPVTLFFSKGIENFSSVRPKVSLRPLPPAHAHNWPSSSRKKYFMEWKMLRKNALAFFSRSAHNLFSVCIFRRWWKIEREKSSESFFGWKCFLNFSAENEKVYFLFSKRFFGWRLINVCVLSWVYVCEWEKFLKIFFNGNFDLSKEKDYFFELNKN